MAAILVVEAKAAAELWRIDTSDPDRTTGGFGLVGSLPSGLSNARGCDLSGSILYVVETNTLWAIDPSDPDSVAGSYGEVGALSVGGARAVVVASNGDLLVVNVSANAELWRVDPSDPDSTAGAYGKVGNLPSGLTDAVGVALAPNGDLFVIEAGDADLWRINPANPASTAGAYGRVGSLPSGLTRAGAATIETDGDILVADTLDDDLWRVNPTNPSSTAGDYGRLGAFPSGISSPFAIAPGNIAPTVSITADRELLIGGAPVSLEATVADTEDAVADLTIAWTSSSGGVFSDDDGEDTTWRKTTGSAIEIVTLTCTVTDTGGLTATASVDVTVRPLDTTFALPAIDDAAGIIDEAFLLVLPVPAGGVPPYTYEIESLPAGLTASGRVILGTPTTAETATVTYTATDTYGSTTSQTFDITIAAATAPEGWSLRVDWDNSAFGHAEADVTGRIVSKIRCKRGRNIASSILGRSVAGTLSVDLDSSDGLFDTLNTSSDLAGLALPGPTVQLRHDADPVWTGYLDRLPITYSRGGAHRAKLQAYGVFALAALEDVLAGSHEATETGDAVTDMALATGIPVSDVEGTYEMPEWIEDGKLLEALRHMEDTEGGFLYEAKHGPLSMQSSGHRAAQTRSLTFVLEGDVNAGDIECDSVSRQLAVKDVVNHATGGVRRFEEKTGQAVYTHEGVVEVDRGESVTIEIVYPEDGLITSLDALDAADLVINTASDGSGSSSDDLTSSVALTGFNRLRIELIYAQESATQPASLYVTTLRVRGTILSPLTPETIERVDAPSQSNYRPKTLDLAETWIATPADMGTRLDAIIEELKQPPLRVKTRWLVDDDNIDTFKGMELSDRALVKLPFYDREGFVESVDLEVDRAGAFALCTTELSLLPL